MWSRRVLALGLFAFSLARVSTAETRWMSVGPDGGDARSFAVDPSNPAHLYLGTTNSWIYQSSDGGSSWSRLARLGTGDDLVADNLIVDRTNPRTIYAAAWKMDGVGGGVFVSHDGGTSWTALPGMQGQSVRALSQARSEPKELVAGTLTGVYRSQDGGSHWTEISPAGSGEIREVESIAIDPMDPDTIYAGTWHLPWKTSDGGAHWRNIKQGVIDDSDVFSIIIDPSQPSVVYASACSGIYKSYDGGDQFRKVQGIPSTARRTRVLMQDPKDRNVVYAGTTEGLYKTTDAGQNWARMTGSDVIINDVYIDPRNPDHVLLATDRGGVLASENAGRDFQASNTGFSERQISSILADASKPAVIYAGVVNDKTFGGVYVSPDDGRTWKQQSTGLDGRDVFSLAEGRDGALLAGTNEGLYRWLPAGWVPDGKVVNAREHVTYVVHHGRKVRHVASEGLRSSVIQGRVNYISTQGDMWFAATSSGVYRSRNHGETWEGPVLTAADYSFVGSSGAVVLAARREDMMSSKDEGGTWDPVPRPSGLTAISSVAVSPEGTLWVGGPEGVFLSHDAGRSWSQMKRLPVNAINGLHWDEGMKRVIVSSNATSLVYGVDPATLEWKWWDTGWKVHSVRSIGDQLVAASLSNGVIMQPRGQELAGAANVGGH